MVFGRLAVLLPVVFASATLAAQQPPQQPTPVQAVPPGAGVSTPRLLRKFDPKYTKEALAAKIEGEVWVEGVVGANGTVDDARVIRSLDKVHGLDEEAVKGARLWLFEPGRKDGQPVPVRVTFIMEFRLDQGFWNAAEPEGVVGLVSPVVLTRQEPQYTSAGLRAKIQGVVEMDVVVMPNGTVGAARIARSLDQEFGLDQEALTAARKWTFTPGTLDGRPVYVRVKIMVEFRLR